MSTAARNLLLRCAAFLAIATLTPGCGGCGGGPPVGGNVTGSATLDEVPLTIGTVILVRDDDDTVRQGDVKNDGSFAIVDVPRGKYKAMVRDLPRPEPIKFDDVGRVISTSIPPKEKIDPKVKNKKGSLPPKTAITPKGPIRQIIPTLYGDLESTPLRFDISGNAHIKVELISIKK